MKATDFRIERLIDTTDIEDDVWGSVTAEIEKDNGDEYYSIEQVDQMITMFKQKYNERLNKVLSAAAKDLLFELKDCLVSNFNSIGHYFNKSL